MQDQNRTSWGNALNALNRKPTVLISGVSEGSINDVPYI